MIDFGKGLLLKFLCGKELHNPHPRNPLLEKGIELGYLGAKLSESLPCKSAEKER
ncbi:MAG: hypothetical protein H6Q48_2218 [Deltaproteobacteria bacterium]|nr:hypothetical protein [Deltaproteobacteria bacterium]